TPASSETALRTTGRRRGSLAILTRNFSGPLAGGVATRSGSLPLSQLIAAPIASLDIIPNLSRFGQPIVVPRPVPAGFEPFRLPWNTAPTLSVARSPQATLRPTVLNRMAINRHSARPTTTAAASNPTSSSGCREDPDAAISSTSAAINKKKDRETHISIVCPITDSPNR